MNVNRNFSDERPKAAAEESGKNGIIAGTGRAAKKKEERHGGAATGKRVMLWLREVKNVVCGGGKSCCGIYRKGKGKGKNF